MNFAACAGLPVQAESRTWFRAIQPHHLPTALSTSHTKTIPSRFGVGATASPQYEVLYLAENHLVALFEVQALLGSPLSAGGVVPHPRRAWTIINITVNLHRVVDLTDIVSQSSLSTTAQELTGDWRGYGLRGSSASIRAPTGAAPTQDLGAALYAVPDLEGFITLSAKLPDQMALVVFPQKLGAGSTVRFIDPTTGHHHSIP
ncbi:MAG: RES family NAD+ phosphorylase [Pyrinomonadaceae bacterium]|nr:RES family NAD+ phosphorylase [Pyrinomonadaceae bacterium]